MKCVVKERFVKKYRVAQLDEKLTKTRLLQEVKSITEISARFLQDQRSWILMPTKVEYYISEDNLNFTYFGSVNNTLDPKIEENIILNFTVNETKTKKARYVKVIAKNFGKLPEWHQGFGGDAFIFIDEITIK